jgi:hypothetical protein
MTSLLIPYIPRADHPDPLLEEFTYGDVESRGKKLLEEVKKGDFIFLHTSIKGRKAITAYYVVEEVLLTSDAYKDREIRAKYKNAHLIRYEEYGDQYPFDTLVFGDPIRSKIINPPLPFDRQIATKLSLNIPFRDDYPDNQMVSSSTRAWRDLTNKDVKVLMDAIKEHEGKSILSDVILSTDEVLEIIEKDLENFIVSNTNLIGKDVKLIGRQVQVKSGRIDLLLENDKEIIVIELKINEIGRSAINQLRGYIKDIEADYDKEVRGILICEDILPSFIDEFSRLKNIEIFHYGWKLHVYKRIFD